MEKGLMQESLAAVQELVLPKLSQLKKTDLKPLLTIKEIREGLLDVFSSKECFEACHRCGGRCCHQEISHMRWQDLFYLVALNPELEIPEPDHGFLAVRPNCLFLSGSGCLLGSNRPNKCLLEDDCPEFKEMGVSEKIKQKLGYLAGDCSLTDFMDEKVRVWVQIILKPEIIFQAEKEWNILKESCLTRLPSHLENSERNTFLSLVKAIKTQSSSYFVLPGYRRFP